MRHYTMASKVTREHIVAQFTNHAYVLPAEEKAASILAAGARANIYDFEAPSQKPRARVFLAEESNHATKRVKLNSPRTAQQCRNARLKKRYNLYPPILLPSIFPTPILFPSPLYSPTFTSFFTHSPLPLHLHTPFFYPPRPLSYYFISPFVGAWRYALRSLPLQSNATATRAWPASEKMGVLSILSCDLFHSPMHTKTHVIWFNPVCLLCVYRNFSVKRAKDFDDKKQT